MPPEQDKSSLKRARNSTADETDAKKPRRSTRLSVSNNHHPDQSNAHAQRGALPSPVTHQESADGSETRLGTITPPANRAKRQGVTPEPSPARQVTGLSSPPNDTQPYSQFLAPVSISYEVEDEKAEGVWGYLVPVTGRLKPMALKERSACPVPAAKTGGSSGKQKVKKRHWRDKEEKYEEEKATRGVPAGGYLIGRHPECDYILSNPTVSNRHALFFPEKRNGEVFAVVEDFSGNGTYVNDQYLGRNGRRELHDGDEISIIDQARFIFRYPRGNRESSAFHQQYAIKGQLGKGHFATVYLAAEKTTGVHYAVKKFEKRSGPGERSKMEGLQQEVAVLMGVSHPNVLCLKDTFDEPDGVYLLLDLAPEGELFNWIVMKQKLTEAETRKLFIQLFQGVKYLHERNIVHRDIKPENVLLMDKDLTCKIADFGLAKIIGEESFTTTLCGTPSYVAPEILEQSNRRRYTKAVDVWSLGVVLYICLSGFPPFSDELYSPDNPYTLSQQIKMGRFDYPSPYWDSVGDPALELIDGMLTVDVDQRMTIDQCLEHPWITGRTDAASQNADASQHSRVIKPTDSIGGLGSAFASLDFSKRKPQRERTLLSAINDVRVERIVETQPDEPPIKVFDKNRGPHFHVREESIMQAKAGDGAGDEKPGRPEVTKQVKPDELRDPEEFVEMGGKGDEVLFDDADVSRYPDETMRAGATAEEQE
ncbi:Forkhead associated domain [Teratosphaeria destructans]|uniref:Forkhead associated domain n=1 Tax=Teratosphaeria destructans TaxID=418781 RepID=A0A9W7SVK4_9PEZI|nr:Forkhead associated domain [Teratosphaeria destructans]